QPVTGVVALCPQFGSRTQGVGNPLGGALVVGGEGHPYMAVVENGVVDAVGLVNLVEALGDQETANAVARHKGECRLEKVQPAQCGKLVQHQQQLVPTLDAVTAVQ